MKKYLEWLHLGLLINMVASANSAQKDGRYDWQVWDDRVVAGIHNFHTNGLEGDIAGLAMVITVKSEDATAINHRLQQTFSYNQRPLRTLGEIIFNDAFDDFNQLIAWAKHNHRTDLIPVLRAFAVDQDGNALLCRDCYFIGRNMPSFEQHKRDMHNADLSNKS